MIQKKWELEFDEWNGLSIYSPIYIKFKKSLSRGDRIYFVSTDDRDGINSQEVRLDDFLIDYFCEDLFDSIFSDSIFSAQRIVTNLKENFLLCDFTEWALLSKYQFNDDQLRQHN